MLWCLPWYTPRSERIKLKSCRNLIDHYLGNFIEKKLAVEQLSVNLFHGTGTVRDISLDCNALNILGNERKWPVEVVECHMEDITVRVPWSNLFKEESLFKVNGLSLTLQPKTRAEPVSSILKWILTSWSKWSSRKRVLINYKKQDTLNESATGQGAEIFADSIDSILQRLKIKLENTKIRIEHVPRDVDVGIALDIHIKNIDYYDEAVTDPIPIKTDETEHSTTYILNTGTNKKIKFEGVSLYTDEFPINRIDPIQESLIIENTKDSQEFKAENIGMRIPERKSNMPEIEFNSDKDIIPAENRTDSLELTTEKKLRRPGPILFAIMNGQQELTLTLKNAENMEGPKIEGETCGPFIVVLSPKQLNSIIELINSLTQTKSDEVSTQPPHKYSDSEVHPSQCDINKLMKILTS